MTQFNLSITLEYDVITHNDLEQLITEVNERLQSGESWQPLGGIIVSENDDSWAGRIFYQAVVRERPEEPVDHTIVRRGGFTFKDVGGLYVKVGED